MSTEQLPSFITVKSFGFQKDGRQVFCFSLKNKNGIELTVSNFGATITSIKIPISNGKKIDIALGFPNVESYEQSYHLPSPPFFGAIVGRYAGRIRNATFNLNGEKIELNANWKTHHLHGGNSSFASAFWGVVAVNNNQNPSITFRYKSPDLEENYPGELLTDVTYTLTEANEIEVFMRSSSSKDTIVNLTQHTYFNLDGHDSDLRNQSFIINSNQLLETDEDNLPTGNFTELTNHPFDFRETKIIPDSMDDTFVLKDSNEVPAAILKSEKSGLSLSVFTNQPGLHVYIGGNCFGEIQGKENANYHSKSGICFETEHFQDSPNIAHFPSTFLKKDEIYTHKTTFKIDLI
jgi:aldose 1-epimerase